MQVVARAFQLEQLLSRYNISINLVSASSSVLKIGLHPAAEHFRVAVHRVLDQPGIYWVEYQAEDDILSFYQTDSVAEMGLPSCVKPLAKFASPSAIW